MVASEIAPVMAWKAFCSTFPHLKLVPFWVRLRSGSEVVAYRGMNWALNPAMPKKERTSSFVLGGDASLSAVTFASSGKIPSAEKM